MKTNAAIILVLLLASVSNEAIAGSVRMSLEPTKISVITAPSGGAHILLGFEDIHRLDGQFVSSVTLRVPLPGGIAAEQIGIELAPITRSWSRGASWDSPWLSPGGDRGAEFSTELTLEKGRGGAELRADVTSMVRGALSGDTAFYGVMVRPGEQAGKVGFDESDRVFLGTMSGARLEIVHRKVRN